MPWHRASPARYYVLKLEEIQLYFLFAREGLLFHSVGIYPVKRTVPEINVIRGTVEAFDFNDSKTTQLRHAIEHSRVMPTAPTQGASLPEWMKGMGSKSQSTGGTAVLAS